MRFLVTSACAVEQEEQRQPDGCGNARRVTAALKDEADAVDDGGDGKACKRCVTCDV